MEIKPIRFTAEEVLATRAGLKTQMRRVAEEPFFVTLPNAVQGDGPFAHIKATPGKHCPELNPHGAVAVRSETGHLLGIKPGEFDWVCPYGQVGDRLWVKETFVVDGLSGVVKGRIRDQRPEWCLHYRADGTIVSESFDGHWRSSTQMPRWASRILLEITGIRVERDQNEWVWVIEFRVLEGI